MTAAGLELDDALDGQDFRPSFALPPLYVLCTATGCPKCRKAVRVHALGCTAFHDAEEGYPIKEFHFLSFVSSVPEELTALLKQKCPSYFLDREEGSAERYLINHCGCGAKIDDDFLHGDVGAAFWPGTRSEYAHMTLLRLPIAEPIPVRCSYALGGGEYLRVSRTLPW